MLSRNSTSAPSHRRPSRNPASLCTSVPAPSRRVTGCRLSKVSPRAAAAVAAEPAEAEVTDQAHPVFPILPAPDAAHFEADNTIFVEEFRIRGNEAGPDQRANIITIANLLQEVGGNHGVAMWGRSSSGFASMPGMDHLIFVATRMQIRMEAYPSWGDIVRLETYFAEDGRISTRRDWRITDVATGRYLGAATSTWVTINTETRRPAKIPEGVKQRFRRLAPSPPRFAIAADQARKKLPEFEWPAQLSAPSQLGRRSDMDPNGHINNVAYLAWALEVIPEHICQDYQLMEVEMDFKAECTAGDQIDCFGMPLTEAVEGNGCKQQFLHLLRKGVSETEVWRARTTWTPANTSSSTSSSSSSASVAVPAAAVAANGAAAAAGVGSSSTDSSRVPSSNGRVSNSNGKAAAPAAAANGSANGTAAAAGSSADSSAGNSGGFLGAVAAFFGLAGSDSDSKN